jgi:cbb3-type cytochrome oxidase subunit 3
MTALVSGSLAMMRFGHFGGRGGGAGIFLLLLGLCFAGLLFWAIGRSGRSTTY